MTASEEKFTRQTLFDMQPLTPNLFTLHTSRSTGLRFYTRQFARLGVYRPSGSIVWRAYSMVSAPHDEFLGFFPTVVPDGGLTDELSRLHEDDQLLVDRQTLGFLTLDHFVDGHDLRLLATDIGVAPFASILRDFEVWERFESIKLVYSVRESKGLAYRGLIVGLAECEYLTEHVHKLQFIPVVARGQVPGCLNEHITALIKSSNLEHAADPKLIPEHSRVVLCDNPQVIEGARAVLEAHDTNLSLTRYPEQVAVESR